MLRSPTFIERRVSELEHIDQARALRSLLEANAPRHERSGEISQEVIDALDAMGAFKMAVPRRWGGLALTATTMADVVAELAKGCPSTAWVVSIINSTVWMASRLPPATQRLVFANGIPRMCSPVFHPAARIKRDGHSYVINGRCGYGSASHHSDSAIIRLNDTEGVAHGVVVPMSQIRIERTWDVTGLKGTGSDTLIFENLSVSADQVFKLDDLFGGRFDLSSDYTLEMTDYWITWPLLRTKMVGVLVGTAEGLIEQTVVDRSRPILFTSYAKKQDSQVFQARIGEAAAKIKAARQLMTAMTTAIDEHAISGTFLTPSERAELRAVTAVTSEMMVVPVEMLMNLIGSSSYQNSNSAQRYWRDFSIAKRHMIFNEDVSYEVYGARLLGTETEIVPGDAL